MVCPTLCHITATSLHCLIWQYTLTHLCRFTVIFSRVFSISWSHSHLYIPCQIQCYILDCLSLMADWCTHSILQQYKKSFPCSCDSGWEYGEILNLMPVVAVVLNLELAPVPLTVGTVIVRRWRSFGGHPPFIGRGQKQKNSHFIHYAIDHISKKSLCEDSWV